MKVGITYDLREDYLARGFSMEETAEFDRPATIDAIDRTLRDLGYETDRIGHVESLMARLVAGHRWDMVFNIAEGLTGFGRESLVPGLLDAYHVPYVFSDPLVLAITLHKATAKRVMRDMGIPTPDFFVVEKASDANRVDLPFPLFAKPVAEGTGKGIDGSSRVNSRSQLTALCARLLRDFRQPVLVETYLPGRELTVGVLGTGDKASSIGAMEINVNQEADAGAYSYQNKERWEGLVDYRLVNDAAAINAQEIAVAAWRGLGCRDGGRVDIRLDAAGVPQVMEINPLAGLTPGHSDLCIMADKAGMSYTSLIESIMQSALERHPEAGIPPFQFHIVQAGRVPAEYDAAREGL